MRCTVYEHSWLYTGLYTRIAELNEVYSMESSKVDNALKMAWVLAVSIGDGNLLQSGGLPLVCHLFDQLKKRSLADIDWICRSNFSMISLSLIK